MMNYLLAEISIALIILNAAYCEPPAAELNPEYWQDQAQKELKLNLEHKENTNVAKNVILFLGDGMGISTITAARIYKGQKKGKLGEGSALHWEKFRDVGLLKTYNIDGQVPDSSGTATAYLCGVKSRVEMVGLSGKAVKGDCESTKGAHISSILEWSQQAKKSTGFVTTSRVTHASPSGLYAHCPHRDWESDGDIPDSQKECKDIARQLIEDAPGNNIKVILGGGRRHFLPNTTVDPENMKANKRTDGRNLIDEWKRDKKKSGSSYKYVVNKAQFDAVDPRKTDYLLGLFQHSHMNYELDRHDDIDGEPSLAEMTEKAIDMLAQNPNGFFLFAEGARIDHAHHDNYAIHALEETLQLDKAVKVALDKTSSHDTLIVVTADHDHALKMSGKQPRGTNILGIAENSVTDGLPFTTLLYATGPGYLEDSTEKRKNLSNIHLDKYSQYLAAIPRNWSAHGGEDVQAYAYGPMSHLFRGTQEQHYVAHAMAYASCVGSNQRHCNTNANNAPANHLSKSFIICAFAILYIITLLM